MPARSREPLVIAHRGESRDAPENTLAAIELAWARGGRAVEFDVRLSADGEVMVIHDADTRRIGGPRTPVSRQTSGSLHALDAGAWKARRWAGERIPTLAEVLATVPRGGRVFIEIKDGPSCALAVARVIAESRLPASRALVMSFRNDTVAAVARALPDREVCLLLTAREWTARGGLARGIARARALGCRALDVQVHRALDELAVANVHAAGFRLYTWTVNRVATARRLARAGIDGITTDRAAWMRERLAGG